MHDFLGRIVYGKKSIGVPMQRSVTILIFFFCSTGILRSQWVSSNIASSGVSSTKLFLLQSNEGILFTGGYNGLWRSSDEGATWQNFPYQSRAIAFEGDTVVSAEGGFPFPTLHFSRDSGQSWQYDTTGPDSYQGSLCFIGDTLFSAPVGGGQGLLRSTELTNSWDILTEPPGVSINTLAVYHDTLIVGTINGIYRAPNDSTLNDSTGRDSLRWSFAGISDRSISTILVSQNVLYAMTDTGELFRSLDSGRSWRSTSPTLLPVGYSGAPLANIGNKLFAGTDSGIFLSLDSGATWNSINDGLPSQASIAGLSIVGKFVFAAVVGSTFADVYRRPLSDFDAGVSEYRTVPPTILSVSVGPDGSEILSYTIPSAGPVRISLYDEIGRDVDVLKNEVQSAGRYSVPIPTVHVPNGIVFCRMTCSGKSGTVKLFLH